MKYLLAGTVALATVAACVHVAGDSPAAFAQSSGSDVNLEGVTALGASAGLSVEYSVSDVYTVDIDVRRGELEDVRIERRGDRLEIGRVRKNGWGWGNNRLDATVTVQGPSLEFVDTSSGASARVEGVSGSDMRLEASSGSSLRVAGSCEELRADASSGATIRADDLVCEDGRVEGSSGASINAYVTGRIDIDVSSGASVNIDGGASIGEADKSSGGSYRVRERAL